MKPGPKPELESQALALRYDEKAFHDEAWQELGSFGLIQLQSACFSWRYLT